MAFSEPPLKVHPVAYAGRFIGTVFKPSFGSSKALQFTYGIFAALFVILLVTVPLYLILGYLQEVSVIAYVIAGAVILKPSFCIKQQWQVANKIKRLSANWKQGKEPEELKTLVGTVSNNNEPLSKDMVISASLRSLSENACDFVVAPLFYFLLLGVPGAVGYRIVNTLDSMVGSRGRYENLGKFSAVLDDVLNYVPARLTALLFTISALLVRKDWLFSIKTALRDHTKPESPNGGWPMAAFAGALGVRLEKAGHYSLGDARNALDDASIEGGVQLFQVMSFISIICCILVIISLG